jgi:translation initiation factor 5B
MDLGGVVSIERDHKSLDIATKGSDVSIKIASIPGEPTKMFGRHFDENDLLISRVNKTSNINYNSYFYSDHSSIHRYS